MIKYSNLTLTQSVPQRGTGYQFHVHSHGLALKRFTTLYGFQRWMRLHGLTLQSDSMLFQSIHGSFYEEELAPETLEHLVQVYPSAQSFYKLTGGRYHLALAYDDEYGRRRIAFSSTGQRINYWLGRAIEEGVYDDPTVPEIHWLKRAPQAILEVSDRLPAEQLLIHEKAVVARARLEHLHGLVSLTGTSMKPEITIRQVPEPPRSSDIHA